MEEVSRKDGKSPYGREERRKERKGRPKARQTSKSETSFGEVWKMALFTYYLLEQNWLCVHAAAEGLQRRMEMMERMQQQQVQVKESRWMEEIPQRWRQPKGEDRTEMRKEEKRLKCTLLNGSAWST